MKSMSRSGEESENKVEDDAATEAKELAAAEDWLRAKLEGVGFLTTSGILRRVKSLKEIVRSGGRAPRAVAERIVDEYFNLFAN